MAALIPPSGQGPRFTASGVAFGTQVISVRGQSESPSDRDIEALQTLIRNCAKSGITVDQVKQ